MPTAITTRSAGHLAAVLEAHGAHAAAGVAHQRPGSAPASGTACRALASDFCSIRPATSSSWRSISHSPACTTVTCMPRFIRPLAASRPSRPPPMTTACAVAARVDHGLGVGDVAVGQHALQVLAGNRQDEGVGAGGQHQAVVCGALTTSPALRHPAVHQAAHAVHLGHRAARRAG